ncbi:MAG: phenylalanine--tRNA ligase subunit beta [Ardenticatenales bacterium]|nr:phenylalanine--tRNA ligase subunit beta [Ardenticatenales bacterium]
MKVPLSWLKDYVDITLPVEALAERLTIGGLEVENIEYIGVPGGTDADRLVWDAQKIVVGQVLEVRQHPNADRLVLATVDYGVAETEDVVTGAPNLFPYVGQGNISHRKLYSPFALEGAELYDGHKEGQVKMTLKGRSLRGVYNRSMLCSEKELGLSDEHEGILFLEGDYTPGTPLVDVLGDVVLDIAIIPNIARCASIIGVAREVAALTGQTVRYPSYDVVMEGPPIVDRVQITTDRPDLNPRFVALVITGVEQKPSPQWMQRRLRLAGQRPINVVVDVSNYVMLEMGEPNHTFDYDFLRRRADSYNPGGPIHIHTRLPQPGETLITLDGKTHELQPYNILVTDPLGNLSLGGVMGGLDSEINDETTNVLLEAASWNYINIRQTTNRLKINSEAGFRFSRGVHPSQAILGARRAAELLRLYAGGTVAQGIVDYYPQPPRDVTVRLTAADVVRLGGLSLSLAEIKAILTSLAFTVVESGDALLATCPDFRMDITGAHDLVEEVCRVYGYDRIPTTTMGDQLPAQKGNLTLEREEAIKDLLVQSGLQEVITYRLTTPERESKLLTTATTPSDDRPYVTLANPITVDRVTMRHSLLAAVMEVTAANSRFTDYIALFELGQIYLASEDGILPDELRRLAIVITGPRQPRHWSNGQKAPAHLDFYDLKGILEQLLRGLHITDSHVETARHPSWRPGRTARLSLGEQQLGYFGELHPRVVAGFEIRATYPVLAAELDLDLLLQAIPDRVTVFPVPSFPPVQEDLALVVDKTTPATMVAAAIQRAGGFLLQDVTLFDVYEGAQLPSGKKSLAYHLTFQAPDKTLRDKDVSRLRQRILKQLEREVGAVLR